jgi:hypothetical protein
MPNRYLCTVLEEMRSCLKTHNFSYLDSLIEEAQILGNRMEAALYDVSDIKEYSERRHKLKQQVEKLEKHVKELGGTVGDEADDNDSSSAS